MAVRTNAPEQPAAQISRAFQRTGEKRVGDDGERLGRQESRLVRGEHMPAKFLDIEGRVGATQLKPFTLNCPDPAFHLHGEQSGGEECT